MDNKVFFQHPDLMRALCVHETVMQLMVNTLNKAQQQQQSANSAMAELISSQQGRRGSFIPSGTLDSLVEHTKVLLHSSLSPPPLVTGFNTSTCVYTVQQDIHSSSKRFCCIHGNQSYKNSTCSKITIFNKNKKKL
jgi:hypothetical protein